jgi:hypothetical protein
MSVFWASTTKNGGSDLEVLVHTWGLKHWWLSCCPALIGRRAYVICFILREILHIICKENGATVMSKLSSSLSQGSHLHCSYYDVIGWVQVHSTQQLTNCISCPISLYKWTRKVPLGALTFLLCASLYFLGLHHLWLFN